MIVDFIKLSPGGNDTIIVLSEVPVSERVAIARLFMSSRFVGGEQVGYLVMMDGKGIDARLEMMGGEFCVNALRCAATVLTMQTYKTTWRLASAGTKEIFNCVSSPRNGSYDTAIALHLKSHIQVLPDDVNIVDLGGISHLLYEVPPGAEIDPMRFFTMLRRQYAEELASLPAFGIIPFQSFDDVLRIHPVVYVRETDTIVPETGCGSGSVTLVLAIGEAKRTYNVIQPSGSIYQVDLQKKESRTIVTLKGRRTCPW